MLYFVQIILQILIICFNICLISHLSYCLALYCNSPADCSYKSYPDSESDPSRVLVRISGENCAYSRYSNLIPLSPSGLRHPGGFSFHKKQESKKKSCVCVCVCVCEPGNYS